MADPDQDGLFSSLRKLPAILVAVLRNRFELLVVEWDEERLRLIETLLLAGAIFAFSLLGLGMLTITVLLAAGEEHRLLAATLITGVYLAAALLAAWTLRKRLKEWTPFSGTRDELRKDCAWLEHKDSNP